MSDPPAPRALHVAHFDRRPHPDEQFSIERVFTTVRAAMPTDVRLSVVETTERSTGVVPRVRALLAARRAARRLAADVEHVTGDVHFLALGLHRERVVLTVHDTEFMTRASAPKRWIYRWVWLRLPVARAAAVTVVSERTRAELLAHVPRAAGKVHVVPNPLPAGFVPAPRPFPAGRATLLQIGTRPNKNLDRLVDAIRGLDVRLWIVGPLSVAQRERLDRAGVEYEQWAELTDAEIVTRYRDCDVVVFVSTHEGFGLPILEANAIGRPVVTSAIEPMVGVAGDAACVVDPLDVASIRAGIERVLADAQYRDRLVTAGHANAERFDAATIAAAYLAVYRDVASRRQGP